MILTTNFFSIYIFLNFSIGQVKIYELSEIQMTTTFQFAEQSAYFYPPEEAPSLGL